MFINLDEAARSFFNILTGCGYTLTLYDAAGNSSMDNKQYRYAFINPIGAMLSLNKTDDESYASISYSDFNYNDEFENLLMRLRINAIKFGLGFKPVSFKKELKVKDFAFSAKNNSVTEEQNMDLLNEHGHLHGASLKRSYQQIGSSRIIIHHNKPVNEQRVGGRGVHIEKMFVENQEGERYSFKTKLLIGAKALANHLSEGGSIEDNVSKKIINLSEQYVDLRSVNKFIYANKRALNETANGKLKYCLETKLNEMSNLFKRLSTVESYTRAVTKLQPDVLTENELDETYYKNLLEVLNLDDNSQLSNSVKTVAKLIESDVVFNNAVLEARDDDDDLDDAGEYDGKDISKLAPPMNRHGMKWPNQKGHDFVDEPGQSAEDANRKWDDKVARDERHFDRALNNPNHPDYGKIQAKLDQFGVNRQDFNDLVVKIRKAYWIAPTPSVDFKKEMYNAAIELLSGHILKAEKPVEINDKGDGNITFAKRLADLYNRISRTTKNDILANFLDRISDDLKLASTGYKVREEKKEFFEIIALISRVAGIIKSGKTDEQYIDLLKNELYSGKYRKADTTKSISKVYAGLEYGNNELREWAKQFEPTRVLLESTVTDLDLEKTKNVLNQISLKCDTKTFNSNISTLVYETIKKYCDKNDFTPHLLETRFYQVYGKGLVEYVLSQNNDVLNEQEVWDMSNSLITNQGSDEHIANITSRLTSRQLEQIINSLMCNWKIEISKPVISKVENIKNFAMENLSDEFNEMQDDFKRTEIQNDFEDEVTR